jgi:hypothetical protein
VASTWVQNQFPLGSVLVALPVAAWPALALGLVSMAPLPAALAPGAADFVPAVNAVPAVPVWLVGVLVMALPAAPTPIVAAPAVPLRMALAAMTGVRKAFSCMIWAMVLQISPS